MSNGYKVDEEAAYELFALAANTADSCGGDVVYAVTCTDGHGGLVKATAPTAIATANQMNDITNPGGCKYIPVPLVMTIEEAAAFRHVIGQVPPDDTIGGSGG